MAHKFKVGDQVKIKKTSRYYGTSSSNPANRIGKVIEYDCGFYNVEWGKGVVNDYDARDLEFASGKPTPKKKGRTKVHTTSYN